MPRKGDVRDRYVFERLLGRGGTAQVWVVRHVVLDTLHALKIPTLAGADLRARLIREGRVQAKLDPTHVVPVTDVIDVDGVPALLMPLVVGCALDDVLSAPMSPAEVSAVMADVLRGLRTAHDAGVVHRDLKPANVLLDLREGGVVARVADFGLARMLDDPMGGGTRPGGFVGTPAWASPEQLRGEAVDARADLWSVGVIVYQLLTGRLPFEADTLVALVHRVERGRFNVRGLPDPWAPLVGALLDVDRDARPATAAEVLAALPDLDPSRSALGAGSPLAERVARRRDTGPAAPEDTGTWVSAPSLGSGSVTVAGRDADLDRLTSRVAATRLVTVLGIGGVGKSRFVRRWAEARGVDWPGGVVVADLAACADGSSAWAAMGTALGMPADGPDPVATLGERLRLRGSLVCVLDDAEGSAQALAIAIPRWTALAPEVHFVVTSRVALGVKGESWFPLDPLGIDAAVAMFVACAADVAPPFDEGELVAVRELVVLLDGLPLAIELAASRTAVSSPRRLVARMTDRFRLLTSTTGRPARHHAMRVVLDASWEQLTDDHRAALARLAVFEGAFEPDAAEVVLDSWADDVLQSLTAQSWVRRVNDRFALLVSVREYVIGQLPDVVAAAEAAHTAWFSSVPPERVTPDDGPDLVAATRRAGRAGASLALHAYRALRRRGSFVVAAELLEATAPEPADDVDARHIRALASVWLLVGRVDDAVRALRRYVEAPDLSAFGAAAVRMHLGSCVPPEEGLDILRDVVARFRAAGEPLWAAKATINLAGLVAEHSDPAEARVLFEEAVSAFVRLGDPVGEGLGRVNLALLIHRTDPAAALRHAHIGVERIETADHRANAHAVIGLIAASSGDLESARHHLDEAVALGRTTGALQTLGTALIDRASTFPEGSSSRSDADEGLRMLRRPGQSSELIRGLISWAKLARAQGRPEDADRARTEARELTDALGAHPASELRQLLALPTS